MYERILCTDKRKRFGIGTDGLHGGKQQQQEVRSGHGFVDSTGSLNAGLSVSAMLREASVAGCWFGGCSVSRNATSAVS